MPKNTGKGGKNFKKGKHSNESRQRELLLAEEGQDYAQVTKMLGGSRVECMCSGGTKVIGVIRGAMRMKVWLCVGDVILVSERDFGEEGKVDVLHKYTPDETKDLIKDGHIPPDFRQAEEREQTGGQTGAGRVIFYTAKNEEEESSDEDSDDDEEDEDEDEDGGLNIDKI